MYANSNGDYRYRYQSFFSLSLPSPGFIAKEKCRRTLQESGAKKNANRNRCMVSVLAGAANDFPGVYVFVFSQYISMQMNRKSHAVHLDQN